MLGPETCGWACCGFLTLLFSPTARPPGNCWCSPSASAADGIFRQTKKEQQEQTTSSSPKPSPPRSLEPNSTSPSSPSTASRPLASRPSSSTSTPNPLPSDWRSSTSCSLRIPFCRPSTTPSSWPSPPSLRLSLLSSRPSKNVSSGLASIPRSLFILSVSWPFIPILPILFLLLLLITIIQTLLPCCCRKKWDLLEKLLSWPFLGSNRWATHCSTTGSRRCPSTLMHRLASRRSAAAPSTSCWRARCVRGTLERR